MTTRRPALVLLALAITGLGYGTPWVLSMLYEAPQVPEVRIERPGQPRAVRVLIRPEPAPSQAPVVGPDAATAAVPPPPNQAPAGLPKPLAVVGPAADDAPRVVAGVLGPGVTADPASTAPKKTRSPRQGRRRHRPCEPARAAIAQVTDQGFRVEDSMVAYYAEHPRETEKLASTWWNKDEAGERDGFKIGRVRCGTLLHQLGLRSGDAIMAINGKPIQSYADGLTAYLRVRHKQLIWVEVVRKGEPMRLDYLLVQDGAAQPEGLAQALDPTALVAQELALAELPWLKRRRGRKVQKTHMRDAAASTRDLGLPGVAELSQLGDLPDD